MAEKFRVHMLETLADATHFIGRNLTLDVASTPPSDQLVNLWNHQREMSEAITARAIGISASELHRACMLVIAERLRATIVRTADIMYASAEDFISDLRCVQLSLAKAGAARTAYGPIQKLIWQAQTFGFHMVEMEFRQHSLVHSRALADIREHGRWGERGELAPMTREVLDTFRAIGQIQRKNGVAAARRYIISFTKSAQNVADVYELAHLAFAHEADVPVLDVIPLFEQVEDLENAVKTLDEMIKLPEVQRRMAQTGRRLEVMLGYSDSSKDAGPTSATLVLHATQAAIAQWAEENNVDLILMHGRGGAVGRGGGPANRAVLSQPKGSVNCRFKLTEQGEVIFARYGDPTLARRHVESVAGATLLQSAPSIEWVNTESTAKYADMAAALDKYSRERYLDLLNTEGFAEWFSTVTPLTEIGLMPIGSRPAKRAVGASPSTTCAPSPGSSPGARRASTWPPGTAWAPPASAWATWTVLRRLRGVAAIHHVHRQHRDVHLKTDERIGRLYLQMGGRERPLEQGPGRDGAHAQIRSWPSWATSGRCRTAASWALVIRMRLPFM